jgi:hypothetical protein
VKIKDLISLFYMLLWCAFFVGRTISHTIG